jgi:biopolymer transport protein ExbB
MDTTPDIVDLVLGFLALLSLIIWTIIIAKAISFYQANQHIRQFQSRFDGLVHINDLTSLVTATSGILARISGAGLEEMKVVQRTPVALDSGEKRDILLHALHRQAQAEQTRMENGLGVLASIGATAPFIGLFGTVWGIMNALKHITATGSAGLDVVAGPIGEALIATAIGIATAVPAVLAYNYYLRKVRLSVQAMNHMAADFYHLAVKSGMKGD